MKKRIPSLIIFSLLMIFCTLAVTQRPQAYYPMVEIEVPVPSGGLTLSFLLNRHSTLDSCETVNGNISRVTLAGCAQCRIKLIQCLNTLDETQRTQLTTAALPAPSGRFANGVVIFNATSPESALSACHASEKQSAFVQHPIKCFGANTSRPQATAAVASGLILWSVSVLFIAFAAAWFGGWLIVKYEHLHAHFSHDHVGVGPQKYHTEPTPRIGGVAVMLGLLAAGGVMFFADNPSVGREFGLLLLACAPAFLGGLVEDITKKVGVNERLLLTMLSGALAAWLLGAVLNRLDIPGVDQTLQWLPFAVVFTSFAVGGTANAVNITDGYNGLAAGYAIIVLVALAYVAYLVGDNLIIAIALAMGGALLGFLVWNWPSGKIFLGDSGAYLLGFILAEVSVLLVARHSEVTPWFPLLLLIYPVFETFFSVYRRMFTQGLSAMQPDNRHLHQLIHDKIVIPRQQSLGNLNRLDANSRVAKYLWIHAIVTAMLSAIFWQSTTVLIGIAIAYCIFYIVSYRQIAQWKIASAGPRKGKVS